MAPHVSGTEAGPAQLVREHACAGWVSPDGKFIYYVHSPNEPGLFRAPLSGGPEEAVLPTLIPGMLGSWAFGPGGIYFVDWLKASQWLDSWAQLLEPLGNVRRLFRVGHPISFDGSVAVLRDGAWMAYSQLDRQGNDILSMRNWN